MAGLIYKSLFPPLLLLPALLLPGLLLLAACSGNNNNTPSDTDLLLDVSHGGGGGAWGLADCDACHAIGVIHQNATSIRHIVKQKGFNTCAGCHGSNGSDAKRECVICHNNNDLPTAPIQTGLHQHDFGVMAAVMGEQILQDEQCLACHYGSDMDGVFENNRDLTRYRDANGINSPYTSGADFCLRCHNRDHQQADFPIVDKVFDDTLIAIKDAYTLIDKHGEENAEGMGTYAGMRPGYVYGSRVECTDCHAIHGTNNIKLIIDQSDKGVSKLDSAMRERPYAVHVYQDNYSQLCVLCHNTEILIEHSDIDTGNGLFGVHLTATSCIECHSHGEAVQAGL